MAKGVARKRLLQGIPLLSFADFVPDWGEVGRVFREIAAWLALDSQGQQGETESLGNIAGKASLLKKVARAWYQGRSLEGIAGELHVEHRLLTAVVGATLKPFLKAYAEVLLPEVAPEFWRRRFCPICGGKPDFAYLEKEVGARWLVCSRCDTEWLFLRLECPYCGTQTQSDLAHFTSEQEPHLYRLYTCERCRTYIKAVDLRCSETEVLIPLERVLTVDMDKMGEEKGYAPGWASQVSAPAPEPA